MKNSIKVERVKKNISQSDLAQMIGVTRQTIYAIENDRFTPSILLAFRIANALKVSIYELFEFDEDDLYKQ